MSVARRDNELDFHERRFIMRINNRPSTVCLLGEKFSHETKCFINIAEVCKKSLEQLYENCLDV